MRRHGSSGHLKYSKGRGGRAGARVLGKRLLRWGGVVGLLIAVSLVSRAQQDQSKPPDSIPDAPSATRAPQPLPLPTPSAPQSEAPPTSSGTSPSSVPPARDADQAPPEAPPTTTRAPSPAVKTVSPGKETPYPVNTRDEIYTLKRSVSFVTVPVTVKDKNGMVDGLLPRDFQVFEDGVKQKLTYFTSDPFFISAAIIFDLGMSEDALRRVQQTFPALLAAFSAYDQVSLYTYSDAVTRVADFSAVNQRLSEALDSLKNVSGRNNGVPITSGPMASGPTVNGLPVGGTPPPVVTPEKEAHVLNDAILRAARDLSKQDRTRRKVIFIISTGRELGSVASYADTLRVLLSNEIAVYGVATGASALPLYNKLSKLHIPRLGYDNLLPKYAAATGGEVFTEFSSNAIDTAYAEAMRDARNQYTLGYLTKAPQTDTYRNIDVVIDIPNLVVRAKYGYYPLPPQRSAQP
jgi:VWFA-related protein